MRLKKGILIISVIVSVCFLVFVVIIGVSSYKNYNNPFLECSLIDILELFITSLIGIGVGYYLSVGYSSENKKNGLIEAYLNIILDDSTYILKSVERIKTNEFKDSEGRDLILSFRMLSNDYNSLKTCYTEILGNIPSTIHDMQNIIFDLKGIITDKPFINKKISSEDYERAFDEYCILKGKLNLAKIELLK